ncbi:helix-turn-helix domain-containing protein [Devosia sp. RR2S18]|uniref:helix-turn-helix domain-containing protein n=1 Tax=Devosia rhizosphaerae TaxID=3049774 RepID=UPI002540F719|nr:helix-turn-helix domain-containing protein [Devosia sp. RR2S18]WIJ25087.1 helix-turn-helix domain-containing protein [Devosia sp. RR2S18]
MDNPNMIQIPTYALYGEPSGQGAQEWLHWEPIQSRSRVHAYKIAPHRHEQFFQVLHIAGGSASVTIDGAAWEMQAPAVVVVPALCVHAFKFSSDIDGVVLTLMQRDLTATGAGELQPGIAPAEASVTQAIYSLIAEADRPADAHLVAMPALITLLAVALRRVMKGSASAPAGGGRYQSHAHAFRDLVELRFRETRRIGEYASALGISTNHLNRVTQRVFGSSALGVIEHRVVLEARRLLLFSTQSVKQIGSDLGYEDPAYFSRFVTRVLGTPPSEFRRAGGRMRLFHQVGNPGDLD